MPYNSGGNLKYAGFMNSLLDLNLYQINGSFNDNHKLLDLVFINDCVDTSVVRTDPLTIPEDHHHPTIEVNLYFSSYHSSLSAKASKFKKFCFKKTNYHRINELLYNTNWNSLLRIPNLNNNADSFNHVIKKFYDRIYWIMNQCIPSQTFYDTSGPP